MWFEEIESVRHAAARLIGASPREIAFLKNTSEGISLVAEGFPWCGGDNVVIVADDYPANIYPWMHLKGRGVTVRTIVVTNGGVSVEDIAEAVDERTRLISINHVHFATGFRADLASIGCFCQAHGIELFVDAIQGLGVFPIDVKAMKIDYLCANSQKWLLAPQGAAVFYIDETNIEKIRPISVGWKSVVDPHNYSRIDFRLREDAARFECGSFVIPSIVALGGSLSLLQEIGISVIQDRVEDTTNYLVQKLQDMGTNVTSVRDGESWSGIVTFELPNIDSNLVVTHCRDRQVVISCRGDRIRVSPHFYNTCDDIDRLIAVLRTPQPV